MTMTTDKEYIHQLWLQYYGNRKKRREREICITCGEKRVLGVRGRAKGKCKKCRKEV